MVSVNNRKKAQKKGRIDVRDFGGFDRRFVNRVVVDTWTDSDGNHNGYAMLNGTYTHVYRKAHSRTWVPSAY